MTSAPSRDCPRCAVVFRPRRKDQRYCRKECAKASSRNASRGPRKVENRKRSEAHYQRAAWLSYDLNRMDQNKRRKMILSILEAASGHDAAFRNILLDPALLGASRASTIGKLYPDNRSMEALNIAKMVYFFCMAEWGCSTRDAIMDQHILDGPWTPAGRLFRE